MSLPGVDDERVGVTVEHQLRMAKTFRDTRYRAFDTVPRNFIGGLQMSVSCVAMTVEFSTGDAPRLRATAGRLAGVEVHVAFKKKVFAS